MSCRPPEQRGPELFGQPPALGGTRIVEPSRSESGRRPNEESQEDDEGDAEDEEQEKQPAVPPFREPVSGTGKERASDVPSWVKNDEEGRPRIGENGRRFAERMLDKRYGKGNWSDRGPRSEYSQIKKYGDRGFQ